MSSARKNLTNKEIEKEKNVLSQKRQKLTIPEIYPDSRLDNSKIPIASDENVEYAREWIEINKL